MADEDIPSIHRAIGRLEGEFITFRTAFSRLDHKIDAIQRTNIAAHERHDAAIAAIDVKLASQIGEHSGKSKLGTNLWTFASSLVAAVIGAVATWFSMGGSGSAHP